MRATRTLAGTATIALLLGFGGVGCGDDGAGDGTTSSSTTAPPTTTAGSAGPSDTTVPVDDDPVAESDDEPTVEPGESPEEPANGESQSSEFPELDPTTIPEAAAPGRMIDAALPTDADGVVSLFDAFPTELLGASKDLNTARQGGIAADYSIAERVTPVGFQAVDVPTSFYGAFLPEPTAEYVAALFASGADWEVEAVGRDGERFWVEWNTTAGGEGFDGEETIWSLVVGDAGSHWAFIVNATDPSTRDELIDVFVATSVAVPEPPPPTADEAAARSALLEPSDLGPDWTSQIKVPHDASFRDLLVDVMSDEPACAAALGQLQSEATDLSGLLGLLTAGSVARADSHTLVARRDASFEVEHSVAVFEDADRARATLSDLTELGWVECLSVVYGDLMQGLLAPMMPGVGVTLGAVTTRTIELGDEGVAVRFETSVEFPDGPAVPAVHDVSIVVVDRAVSALVQTTFGGDVADAEVDEIVALAADVVSDQFAG
jgi:hypothetical protein